MRSEHVLLSGLFSSGSICSIYLVEKIKAYPVMCV